MKVSKRGRSCGNCHWSVENNKENPCLFDSEQCITCLGVENDSMNYEYLEWAPISDIKSCETCFNYIDDWWCSISEGEECNRKGTWRSWKPKTEDLLLGVADDTQVDKGSSHNNGGPTDYYDLPDGVTECQGIIEWRKMNFSQGTIMKACFCFNSDRHSATNYERELNKIIYFAERELTRIKREGK